MNYSTWLDCLKEIEHSNRNRDVLSKILEEDNPNLTEILSPKIIELINKKIIKAIKRMQIDLDKEVHDENTLALILENFNKDINYILELCQIKLINPQQVEETKDSIYKQANNIYQILIDKSLEIDKTGMLRKIINNKRIKR